MPVKKAPPAKKPPVVVKPPAKPPAKPAGKPSADSRTVGEAALHALDKRLAALPPESLAPPRADVRQAASFVVSKVVPRLRDRGFLARLHSLPEREFDHSVIDDLAPAAHAALWAQTALDSAEAQLPGARLPVALIDDATSLRARMLRLATYHLEELPSEKAELDDIRTGTGYLDLANDLRRLAVLYRRHQAVLQTDRRYYQPGDEKAAHDLSTRIESELAGRTAAAARDTAYRTWALLLDLYEEFAAAARFLGRKDGSAPDFPTLYTVGRSSSHPSRKPAEPAPSPAPSKPEKPTP